jgi:hypothetical protein
MCFTAFATDSCKGWYSAELEPVPRMKRDKRDAFKARLELVPRMN